MSPKLQQPSPSWAAMLEARNVLVRLVKGRTESAVTLQYWAYEQVWSCPVVEASTFLPNKGLETHIGSLPLLPQTGSPHRMLRTPLPGLEEKLFLKVFSQGLVPLSWGYVREPKHTGQGQKHIHNSLVPRRALVNLSLSGTFLAWKESHSGSGVAYTTQGHWEPDSLHAVLSLGGQPRA